MDPDPLWPILYQRYINPVQQDIVIGLLIPTSAVVCKLLTNKGSLPLNLFPVSQFFKHPAADNPGAGDVPKEQRLNLLPGEEFPPLDGFDDLLLSL